jgi:hypothetical protein
MPHNHSLLQNYDILPVSSQVFKDYLQILAILRMTLNHLTHGVFTVTGAVAVTPLTTHAWGSLDCVLPRSATVMSHRALARVLAAILMPGETGEASMHWA